MQAVPTILDTVPEHPKKLKDTIALWTEISELGEKYNCLSLAWGSPNLMPPQFLIEETLNAMNGGEGEN